MKNKYPLGIKLLYCRTLSSQSGASVTMGSIASCLRNEGHEVELIFGLRTDLHKSQKILLEINKRPVIIYKPNFKDYPKYFPLLKNIKLNNQKVKLFLCGPFASLNAESIMKNNNFIDGVILGDPEETICALIKSANKEFSRWDYSLPGGVWRDKVNKKIIFAKKREVSPDLDSLPFPARDIEKKENVSYINLEASRGCLFNCSFCHVPLYHTQNCSPKRRIRSPRLVVDEIERLNKELKKTLFIFNDQLFWAGKQDDERIREICKEIIKRKLKIKFYIYLRSNPFLDNKLLDLLVKAGLVRVFLGTENASEECLKNYKKNTTASASISAFEKLKKKNINVHIGHIVFEPRSTINDIRANIEFLYALNKLYRLGVILEPPRMIPGSAMLEELQEENLINSNLNYENTTYSFNFKDTRVNDLFSYIRELFLKKLKKRWYEFEYYCVSGLLLIDLAKKEGKNNRLNDKKIKNFIHLTEKSNNFLYDFFIKIIDPKIRTEKNEEKFVSDFLKLREELEYSWGEIAEFIRLNYGNSVMRELYKGVEPL